MSLQDRQERLDPLLSAAYSELRREPAPDIDWEALRRAIDGRAEPMLARRRVRGILRVSRPFVPLAMAASIAFSLWVGPTALETLLSPGEVAAVEEPTLDDILVQALDGDVSEQEFRLLVTGRSNPEALLAVAIGDR